MGKKYKPTWTGYQNSGFYNASGVGALQGQMGNYSTDREALGQQADLLLRPQYNTQELALRQELERMLAGYANQASGMEQSYDMQKRATNSQYNKSGVDALNQLGKRGMGRSSIVATTMASLEGGRNQALGDIDTKLTDARDDLGRNIALANSQGAMSARALADNYALQRTGKAEELYNANLAAQANLQVQMAQLSQAGYNAYVSWVNSRNKGGGGGGGGGSKSSNGNNDNGGGNDDFVRYSNNQNAGQTGAAAGWFSSGVR